MKKLLPVTFLLISWNIHAQQPPVACFTGDSSNMCVIDFTDLSLGTPTAWAWTFTGGVPATSTIQHPPGINWPAPGTYTVSLTVTNGFGVDTETKVTAIQYTVNTCYFDTTAGSPCLPTGLQDLTVADQGPLIYPNPTSGKFTVANATAEIQVYDLFGRLVLETPNKEIDMSSYPAGIYMVKVGEAVRKLILNQ